VTAAFGIGGAALLWPRPAGPALNLRLKPLELVASLGVVIIVLDVRAAAGAVDGLALAIMGVLALYCVGILYFQRRQKGRTLLDEAGVQAGLDALPLWVGGVVAFAGVCVGAYGLPRFAGETDLVAALAVVFTGYGLIWLPAVSLVLGARAFARQARALRL
jgi:hypothetical protein